MIELPPLSLQSGPAISGQGGNYGGSSATGEFVIEKRRSWSELVPLALAVGVVGVMAWKMARR